MMKNMTKIVAMLAIACVLTLKASDNENVSVSDIVLANMEALAEPRYDLPEVEVVCSKKCTDGKGKCWIPQENDPSICDRSPDVENKCIC